MKKLKRIFKDTMRNHYAKKCGKNIDERTKLLDDLAAMKYEENPTMFKKILAEVTELSKKYDKLYEKRVKYY